MTYQVLPDTPVRIKRIGTMWTAANIDVHSTTKVNLFTDQDVILDPSRVFAPVENTVTARQKARWMECGYYGFRRGEWLMLVPEKLVLIDNLIVKGIK